MAEVSVKCGLTLKLTKNSQFEFFRPELEISKLDINKTDEEIKADIARALKVSDWAFEELGNKMSAIVKEQADTVEAEVKEYSKRK